MTLEEDSNIRGLYDLLTVVTVLLGWILWGAVVIWTYITHFHEFVSPGLVNCFGYAGYAIEFLIVGFVVFFGYFPWIVSGWCF